jgi:bacillithiol biosynthesis cysteine-adding enzyme BshC
MDCRALLPSQLPHTTRFVRDYVENFPKVERFFAHPPDLKSVVEYAKNLSFLEDRRKKVAEILRQQNRSFGAGAETEANLQLLEGGAVAIVSGQQVGLFGGPSYSVYKALSAIQTARELRETGVPAVPIFWMATEDHDVDEVRHATWFTDGALHRLELAHPDEQEAAPVGQIKLGPAVDDVLREAAITLGGPDGAAIAAVLREAYVPSATYGDAFARLFTRIFESFGLILLDPLDERLHKVAGPFLRDALAQRDLLNEELLERSKELDHAGYASQVKVTSRSTLLFTMEGGKRQVLSAANNHFLSGEDSTPREEWLRRVEEHPERFSPNALLRPVMQDYLLPTAAYFAGPAEIAYYAQTQVIYEKLLGRMPVILPRADFTLVDPKALRILKKYGLKVEDVWEGKQSLRRRMYASNVPKKLAKKFDASLRDIQKITKKLQERIAGVDPTLKDTVARAEKRLLHQLEKLRLKTGAALDRHQRLIERHAEFLENLLYPGKSLQSRELCFLPFLARLGTAGLHDLLNCASAKKPGRHAIVPIP